MYKTEVDNNTTAAEFLTNENTWVVKLVNIIDTAPETPGSKLQVLTERYKKEIKVTNESYTKGLGEQREKHTFVNEQLLGE